MNIIDKFAEFLIQENCHGCEDCDVKARIEGTPYADNNIKMVICSRQAAAEWILKKLKQYKKSQRAAVPIMSEIENIGNIIENVELPKHTNPLPMKTDNKVEPYKNVNVIFIPENATNGDMIKALYPTAEITDHFELGTPIGNIIYIRLDKYQEMRVQQDWWNTPYNSKGE